MWAIFLICKDSPHVSYLSSETTENEKKGWHCWGLLLVPCELPMCVRLSVVAGYLLKQDCGPAGLIRRRSQGEEFAHLEPSGRRVQTHLFCQGIGHGTGSIVAGQGSHVHGHDYYCCSPLPSFP